MSVLAPPEARLVTKPALDRRIVISALGISQILAWGSFRRADCAVRPVRFPLVIGRLAVPSLIVQALAPSAGALLMEAAGVDAIIATVTLVATVNVALIGALWRLCRLSSDGA